MNENTVIETDIISTKKIERPKHIESLDCLRVLGMVMIFFNHVVWLLPFKIPDFGARAVDIFFILSGFLLAYNYYHRDLRVKNSLRFGIGRIKKFYPLHVITMLFMAWLVFIDLGNSGTPLPDYADDIGSMILNLLLLQSWMMDPNIYWGYNGVSWFLSSLFFSYLMFIIFIKISKKIFETHYDRYIFIMIILGMYFAVSFVPLFSDKSSYLFYIFPIYRAFEFFLGCLMGIWLLHEPECAKPPTWIDSAAELAVLILYFVSVFYMNDKWTITTFMLLTMVMIYVLARQRGRVSRILSNKYIRIISLISFEFYLIHYVVITYYSRWGDVMNNFLFDTPDIAWEYDVLIMFVISLVISCAYYLAYGRIMKILKRT